MMFESNGCFVRGPARPGGSGYKQFVIELPTPLKAQMTAESLNAFMQQASSLGVGGKNEPPSLKAAFNHAIAFAIRQGVDAASFLSDWSHGDTSRWPEFDTTPILDLDEAAWDEIKAAADQSKWIPQDQYTMNDWVSDVCTFLREVPAPIDMVLHCPSCGLQHIDKDNTEDLRIEAAETGRDREGDKELDRWLGDNEWANPPHRSHLCLGCGHIWRPADVPTNGVKAVSSTGKADSPIGPSSNQTLRHVAVIAHSGGLAQLSEADALAAVRRLTLAHWDKRHDQRKAALNALYDSHQKAAT